MPDVPQFMEQRKPVSAPMQKPTKMLILLILELTDGSMTAIEIRNALNLKGVKPRLTDVKRHLDSLTKHQNVKKKFDSELSRWNYWKD